jgi:hypothetical protein
MSDTPETDNFEWAMSNRELSSREKELLMFARKLERERDEAIKARNHNRICVERLAAERDQLRKVCDELAKELNHATSGHSIVAALHSYNSLPHVIESNKNLPD